MTEIRERRGVFGEAADAYDAARPGFPEALVDDVIEYTRLDGAPVLEVGAGTGQASVPYSPRGLQMTCLEPHTPLAPPRLARVLLRRGAPIPAPRRVPQHTPRRSPDSGLRVPHPAGGPPWRAPGRGRAGRRRPRRCVRAGGGDVRLPRPDPVVESWI